MLDMRQAFLHTSYMMNSTNNLRAAPEGLRGSKRMDHTEYPKMCARKSDDELRYTIKDCTEALAAMPTSSKASYYADEGLRPQ